MKTKTLRTRSRRNGESGQVMLFVLLALGFFLIGSIALAVDLSHLWFQRQAAQTAADAACTAAASATTIAAASVSATDRKVTVSAGQTTIAL